MGSIIRPRLEAVKGKSRVFQIPRLGQARLFREEGQRRHINGSGKEKQINSIVGV